MAYRAAVHETVGQFLARVIFGNDLRLPIDFKFEINTNGWKNAKGANSILKEEFREIQAVNWVLSYSPQWKKGLSPKI